MVRVRHSHHRHSSFVQSTSFTSGDDGKTVTIPGAGGSKTTASGVEFVEQEKDLDTVSYEVLDAFDESFDTDQDDILNRLANIKNRNQINFNDQVERVYAVTKLIEKKEKITLNPQSRSVRELVNRSSVKTLKDGVDVLYFRSKKGMEKSGLQITNVEKPQPLFMLTRIHPHSKNIGIC
jgi:hypothetical protein